MKRAHVVGIAACLVVAAVAGGALAFASWLGQRKLERQVFVKVVPVPYASGPAAIKQGKYLYETRGCISCHGADGAGRAMIEESNGLYVRSPNLTRGANSAVAEYTEADWVRAIRHGVNPKGHALFIMPSELYNRLSDADFASLVAYVRSLPPVAGSPTRIDLPFIVRALYGIDLVRDASEKIAHSRPPDPAIPASAGVAHGAYVARICMGCHGDTLAGGRTAETPPDDPVPANLTPGEGSVMPRYDSLEKFTAMMRSGRRPDGSAVRMPFDSLAAFNDTDLAAIYAYLNTLSPLPTGTRKPGHPLD
jgi:mono/diheme cytochrome c family protein